MTPPELQRHITQTYISLRVGIGLVALALPLILWIGGRAIFELELQRSISVYYHTSMRNVFVGALIFVGSALYLYKGFSKVENYVLNVAGVLALGIAFLPSSLPEGVESMAFTAPVLHGVSAVGFFACIAYVCMFRAEDTVRLIEDENSANRFRRWYKTIGTLMIILPVVTAVLALLFQSGNNINIVIFVAEFAAVWVFAVFWLVKSYELKRQTASLEFDLLHAAEGIMK